MPRLEASVGVASGCLFATASAVLTGGMLFINGSLVLAIIQVMAKSGVPRVGEPQFAQFLIFTVPLAMAVIQWWMIDYVRRRLRFGGSAPEMTHEEM